MTERREELLLACFPGWALGERLSRGVMVARRCIHVVEGDWYHMAQWRDFNTLR